MQVHSRHARHRADGVSVAGCDLSRIQNASSTLLGFIAAEVDAAGSAAVPLLIGHNGVAFDLAILCSHRDGDDRLPADARVLDTISLVMQVMPGGVSRKLVKAAAGCVAAG